jgi:Tol biopolymer transport system component
VERNAFAPTVTPDGESVLYSPAEPGLFSVPLGGGKPRQLSDRFVTATQRVTPDGTRLAFATDTIDTAVLCDLPDCTNAREIHGPQVESVWRWAPDSRGLAFVNPSDPRNLWEEPLDGSPGHPLTKFDEGPILEFAWSPDGKRLAVSRGHWANDATLIKGLR